MQGAKAHNTKQLQSKSWDRVDNLTTSQMQAGRIKRSGSVWQGQSHSTTARLYDRVLSRDNDGQAYVRPPVADTSFPRSRDSSAGPRPTCPQESLVSSKHSQSSLLGMMQSHSSFLPPRSRNADLVNERGRSQEVRCVNLCVLTYHFKQQGSNREIRNNRYVIDSEEEDIQQIDDNRYASRTTGRASTQRGPSQETLHVAEQPNTRHKQSGTMQSSVRNKRQYVEAFTNEAEIVSVRNASKMARRPTKQVSTTIGDYSTPASLTESAAIKPVGR